MILRYNINFFSFLALLAALIFVPSAFANNSHDFLLKKESAIISLLSDFELPKEGNGSPPQIKAFFDENGMISDIVFLNRRGYMKYQGELRGILAIACTDYRNTRSDEAFVVNESLMVNVTLVEMGTSWYPSLDADARHVKTFRVPSRGSRCEVPRHIAHRYQFEAR